MKLSKAQKDALLFIYLNGKFWNKSSNCGYVTIPQRTLLSLIRYGFLDSHCSTGEIIYPDVGVTICYFLTDKGKEYIHEV